MATQKIMTAETCYNASTALTPSKREIRLIELLPDLPAAEIKCRLRRVSLNDTPSYETMSYAWGRPEDTRTVQVNETSSKIPANLEDALRYIRRPDMSLTIWADSICINQDDENEKTAQVAMMGDIYSSCTSVYIWLGIPQSEVGLHCAEETRNVETAINPFTLALHFANDSHLYELPCFQRSESTGQWTFVPSVLFQNLLSLHIEGSTRAWWSRLWCVQEAILPPNATVVFGRWKIPLATLKLTELRHTQHLWGCCSQASALFPVANHYVQRSDRVLQLYSEDVNRLPGNVSSDFDKVFRTFRYKFCENPKDRIYGLLGLLDPSKGPQIVPDYTRSVHHVYLNATEVAMMRSDGDLRFLTGSGFHSQKHGLPSWVRNFAAPISQQIVYEEMRRYEAYSLYNAAASTQANPKRRHDLSLSLAGIRVDRITEVGLPVLADDRDALWKLLLSWTDIARRADVPGAAVRDAIKGGTFWRVIQADAMLVDKRNCRRLTSEDVPRTSITSATKGVRDFMGSSDQRMEIEVKSVEAATYGRSMFRTEAGRIGLCLPESQVGDEVWVLHGGRVPFVLRLGDVSTVEDLPEAVERYHHFIGEAYLHGVMDGEAMSGTEYPTEEVLLL